MNKLRMLVAGLAATMIVLVGAQPAKAVPADCPLGYFCIWYGNDGLGTRYQFPYSQFLSGQNNGISFGSGLSNRGYSFYNRLGETSGVSRSVAIIDSAHCNPTPWFRKMVNAQFATTQGSDWGGRVSSIQLYSAVVAPGSGPYLPC